MKRYLVFSGNDYYPYGGWKDFRGSFDTELEAWKSCANDKAGWDWHQVIDSHNPPDPESI